MSVVLARACATPALFGVSESSLCNVSRATATECSVHDSRLGYSFLSWRPPGARAHGSIETMGRHVFFNVIERTTHGTRNEPA